MKNLSNETKIEAAMQMAIMDAIEKGHVRISNLVEYMKSEVFKNATNRYVSMINEGN
jgi:hypothetical protein